MGEHPEQITQWLDAIFSYGPLWVYAALLVACFIENIFPPFPGDSFIVAAGGLVAAGRLSLVPSALLILAGGVGSAMVMYYLGRRFGRDYFLRKDFKYFSAEDIHQFEDVFQRRGVLVLVFSRFVVGLRSVIAVGAGMGRYSATGMVVLTTVSYLLFGGLLFGAGMVLVANLNRITYYLRTYNAIVWPIVIAVVAVVVVRKVIRVYRTRQGGKTS